MFEKVASYEQEFGLTIQRGRSIRESADRATEPYQFDESMAQLAMSREYTAPVVVSPWELPAGAFGESVGPV